MRVLLTNGLLVNRAGSELYLLEVATRLLALGHSPVAYSPCLGPLAAELRAATIPAVDDLAAVAEPPDVIHGQHHLPAMTALLHFPGVPALFVSHGWAPWEEAPPRFPRILRYVAVDHTTRERLVSASGIPPERVEVILNFVDLARFRPRSPLPPAPRRALVFSNQASEETHLPVVREACSRFGIALDVAGVASGRPAARPETLLPGYDLVFAKGRSALEAMAVGAAVVLCDQSGAGPMVTTESFDRLRPLNFGIRTLREPVAPDVLAREIGRYDPADAAEVSRRVRAEAGLEAPVDRLAALYAEVIAEHRERGPSPAGDEGRAAATYLRWLDPHLQEQQSRLKAELDGLVAERDRLVAERDRLVAERDRLAAERDRLAAELDGRSAERDRLTAQAEALRRDLAALQGTATWRLRERLVRSPLLLRLYRGLRR
ncbi:MAG TPA: glycosyltransferase [Thermoanaerobaculia bacterium]|nr:glycosyltransferase [Thermoanaerobaculia bacterium]